MSKSRAIIMALDDTQGVEWEIATLARETFVDKTLFLCPPRFQSPDSNRRLWQHVKEALSRGRPDDAEATSLESMIEQDASVLAFWTGLDQRGRFATASRFSYNRYYMTLRWFFRSRWGAVESVDR
jgi:hypothetical protein